MNEELMAFLRECPTGLANIDDLELSKLVLHNLLADGRMAPGMLLERACHSMFHDELVRHLNDLYLAHENGSQWEYFLLAVLRNWNKWPEVRFSQKIVDDFAKLRVQHYIVKRDYRRAWDELNKLRDGFSMESEEEVLVFSISVAGASALVEELFRAMEQRKLLKPLEEKDYICVRDTVVQMAYETRPPKGRRQGKKPRDAFRMTVRRAGWKFAVQLGVEKHRHDDRPDGPCIFTLDYALKPAGGMVLKIADYFRKQRSEARRRKHKKALAEYRAGLGQ